MKKIIYFLPILIVFFALSCGEKKEKKYLLTPTGPINSVAIVTDNQLWKGALGDTLRTYLAQPLEGIPGTPEALFSLHQMPASVFSGNTRSSRNVLIVEQGKSLFLVKDSVYAKSQKIVILSEETLPALMQKIQEKSTEIIKIFKENDIKENQNRFKKSPVSFKKLPEKLKIDALFPSSYSLVKEKDHFFWFEKRIKGGTNNVIFYEIPFKAFPQDTLRQAFITQIRDKAGERYIPGREKGMYMITSPEAPMGIYSTAINGKFTLESKGFWEMKNFLLGGPFINYIIEDKVHNRLLVAEGFVLAPGIAKRDNLSEMEAIIKSIVFK